MEKKFVHANLFVNVINQVPFSHPSYTQGYIDKIIYFIYNHLSLDIVSSTYTTSAYYKKTYNLFNEASINKVFSFII